MLQGVGGIGLHSSKRAGSCIWKYMLRCACLDILHAQLLGCIILFQTAILGL